MKRLITLLFILPGVCFGQITGDTQKNDADVVEFLVTFKKTETPEIQKYLNKKLSTGDMSFTGTQLDATVTLDDGITFYIQLQPGILKILFDKKRNSEKNYLKMKETCDGISKMLK